MSNSNDLIYYGTSLKFLEETHDDLHSKMINIEEFGKKKDQYKLLPLQQVMGQIGELIREHQFMYLISDKTFYETQYTEDYYIKHHWVDLFKEPCPPISELGKIFGTDQEKELFQRLMYH